MIIDLSTKKALTIFSLQFIFLIVLSFFKNEYSALLLSEYGLIESLTALFYLISTLISLKSYFSTKGLLKIFFLFWFFLSLFFMLEETSFMQHYIGFETPEIFKKNNSQKEFNFHNLNTNEGSLTNAIVNNKIDISIFLKSQNLFNIGFISYFLFLPFLAFSNPRVKKSIFMKFSIPVISIKFIFCIWIPITITVLMGFADINNQTYIRSYYGETREMFFAITIMLYLYLTKKNKKI